MLRFLPLPPEEVAVLRFTQLRLAAHSHDTCLTKSPTHAYRDARFEIASVQLAMRRDDRVDAELMATVEENNDRFRYDPHRAHVRRAFVGIGISDLLEDAESLRLVNAVRW